MKGGEVEAPFVLQESADGCNPFQNAQRKYIETECRSAGGGRHFSVGGCPLKGTQVGSVFGTFAAKSGAELKTKITDICEIYCLIY